MLAQLREEHYGYALRKALLDSGLDIEENTLYPLLRRLESQGLLASEWREEDRRTKRFYRLSADGERMLDRLRQEWQADQRIPRSNPLGDHDMHPSIDTSRTSRTYLPADQADDIVNELSENLRAQFEDRENDLGRPLTDAEQEAILKDHGNPLVVASRYRKEQPVVRVWAPADRSGPVSRPIVQVLTHQLLDHVARGPDRGRPLGVTGQPIGSTSVEHGAGVRDPVRCRSPGIFIAADRAITGDGRLGSSRVAAALPRATGACSTGSPRA